jgi:hypothetical protein
LSFEGDFRSESQAKPPYPAKHSHLPSKQVPQTQLGLQIFLFFFTKSLEVKGRVDLFPDTNSMIDAYLGLQLSPNEVVETKQDEKSFGDSNIPSFPQYPPPVGQY